MVSGLVLGGSLENSLEVNGPFSFMSFQFRQQDINAQLEGTLDRINSAVLSSREGITDATNPAPEGEVRLSIIPRRCRNWNRVHTICLCGIYHDFIGFVLIAESLTGG